MRTAIAAAFAMLLAPIASAQDSLAYKDMLERANSAVRATAAYVVEANEAGDNAKACRYAKDAVTKYGIYIDTAYDFRDALDDEGALPPARRNELDNLILDITLQSGAMARARDQFCAAAE